MKSTKWIKIFFGLSLIGVLFLGGVNYIVDPYGINNRIIIDKINLKKYSNTSITARFKLNILNNKNIETIMLGTSRIGVMNPMIVDKYLNTNTFNLEYPASITPIQNKLFKYASNFNDIKYLVYGIDFMSFNENRKINKHFLEFNDFIEKIENNEKISNIDLYFSIDTFLKSIKIVIKNILGIQNQEVLYLKNGMRDYQNYIEQEIKNIFNFEEEKNNSIKSYFSLDGQYKNYKFSYDYLEHFKDTMEFCKKNNIKVFVYIPPMFSEHFNAINAGGYFDEFELFKKELVKITDFIDFTGHNTISKNKNNYWDSSHLRVETTEVLMAKLFNDKSVEVPADFGVLVTKDNIDEHLENLRKQIKEYDLNKIIK
ncbi:hypothetical protein [Arcobacter porcinus]|uniref:DUF1574 domain-containing protein n=1 Tax=Arcobacter porcinus TaxID=1935204 RepID=A0A1C0B086_9BACT|nr:hypothetical protein [Arcobacter porcinus]OCL91365.1 hypothetical protein AAX27_01312 [Aliarcobacter thereius]OCL93282.1 hypothetical protein AAX28_00825 [Arcobacter porcinus]QEP40317.1 hypothetical protein APORC_0702 [Arcobacter porcinus]